MGEGLRTGNREACETALRGVIDYGRSDAASCQVCRRELARFARSVMDIQSELLPNLARKFRSEVEAEIIQAPDVQQYAAGTLSVIADFLRERASASEQRSAIILGKVRTLIDQNLGGDLSLSYLGDRVGVSAGYLGRIFKQETGATIIDYVNERRLSEAARLLASTLRAVQDIGAEVGFHSPTYFNNRFKARFGQTPVEFRRLNMKRTDS